MHPATPVNSAPTPIAHRGQTPNWKTELREAISDPDRLCEQLGLDGADRDAIRSACRGFPLRVPRGFVARMRVGDPGDPLLRQVLPDTRELIETPGYSVDPLGEAAATAIPGLLHKYPGRALLTLTSSCAVHCRYCFRRHFPYQDHRIDDAGWQQLLDYLRADSGLSEIILSGGDPLNIPDRWLARRVDDLASIPHLQRLRIHSRQPIVLPSRVDERLLDWLTATRLQTVLVIHANHPNEIDDAVAEAMSRLAHAGAHLLNQSVLLRDINDDANTLAALSEKLFSIGVLPYYLHLLDPVQGAAHFAVDEPAALALRAALQARLPGYLVPRLAREVAGETSKRHL